LLLDLKPTENLFDMAKAMFRALWEHRAQNRLQDSSSIESELRKVDRQVEQFLGRVVDADNQSVISAYEKRIKDLEGQKIILGEKIAKCGTALPDFDETFRTAFEFLANPHRLWASESLADKRTTLKLVFAEKLPCYRNEGFRTASYAQPFRLLEGVQDPKYEMARPEGFEPPTAWFVVSRANHNILF